MTRARSVLLVLAVLALGCRWTLTPREGGVALDAADAVSDAVIDADGAPDGSPDIVSDIGPDVVSDIGPDVVSDIGPDVVSDIGPDIVSDIGPDGGGPDGGRPGFLPPECVTTGATPQTSCSTDGGTVPGCGLIAVTVSSSTFTLGNALYPMAGKTVHEQSGARLTTNLWVDAYEVTVARFRAFAAAGLPPPSSGTRINYPGDAGITWNGWSVTAPATTTNCNWTTDVRAREAHPINCVDWATAVAFCAWDGGRLPTEAEAEWIRRYWRYAGDGGSDRRYPWGSTPPSETSGVCDRAQILTCAGTEGAVTRQVGSFAHQGCIFDLAGNVTEWAADRHEVFQSGGTGCWTGTAGTDPLCEPTSATTPRVIRGGEWAITDTNWTQSFERAPHSGDDHAETIGFRCVRSR